MSPNGQPEIRKKADDLYTAVLALAFGAVFATAVIVAYKCLMQYDTIFSISL
jgi:hypothetical protein